MSKSAAEFPDIGFGVGTPEQRAQVRAMWAQEDKEVIRQAYAALRELRRLKRLWRQGRLAACTIPAAELVAMRVEFFARGGVVTKCPPGEAQESSSKLYWHRWISIWEKFQRRTKDAIARMAAEGVEVGLPVLEITVPGSENGALDLADGFEVNYDFELEGDSNG